jgi:hypothetical protein
MTDRPDSATLDLAGDNSYIVSALSTGDTKSDDFENKLFFKKIAENIYAYSRREIDKETGTINHYAYGYVRVLEGDKIATYEPYCTDFHRTELEKLGVEIIKPDGDTWTPALCKIPSVEVLETLLRSYLNDPKNAEKIKDNDDQSTMHITTK